MSIEQTKSELHRFLSDPVPSVICVSGKWGTGKTYSWNEAHSTYVTESSNVEFAYAYISLFGCNSIEDVKKTIVESLGAGILSYFADKPDKNQTLVSKAAVFVQKHWNTESEALNFLKQIVEKKFSVSADVLYRTIFSTLRGALICFDNLERIGPNLKVGDVLGLASNLKTEKSCKIVFLLNQDAFEKDNKADFQKQIEKVSDVNLQFNPTAAEAAAIGVDENLRFHAEISRCVTSLEIVNIRTIKRIEKFCERIDEILKGRDKRILDRAIQIISLAVFAKYQPDDAPPIEFIGSYSSLTSSMRKISGSNQDRDPKVAEYEALLAKYEFGNTNDFDRVILDGIVRGYFEVDEIERQSDKKARELLVSDKDSSFSAAWGLFHNTFENNGEKFVDALCASIKENFEIVTPINLNSSIIRLKQLGERARAVDALNTYVDKMNGSRDFWDLSSNSFRGMNDNRPVDEDMEEIFKAKFASLKPTYSAKDLFINFAGNGFPSDDQMQFLVSLNELEIIQTFKQVYGPLLRTITLSMLQLRGMQSGNENHAKFGILIENALRTIARGSEINRLRVENLGLKL